MISALRRYTTTEHLHVSVATALVAALTLAAPPHRASAQDVDLSGEWILTVESPNGTGTRQVTFVQEGNELTGTVTSSMAAGDLKGTVDGNLVTFVAVVSMDSGDFEITYRATYEDGRLTAGTVDFGDYGDGTFTGVRKESGSR